MNKTGSLVPVIILVTGLFLNVHFAWGQAPAITAQAAVLMDAETGQVLYDKNMHQRRPQASTTKIMTAILALESGKLDQVVEVTPKAASVGESSIHLRPHEKLTLEELLYGAMLRSGNDACVAIAEHIAGTEANFVNLMNYQAKLLGGYNTNFCNTNGLPHDNHYSSAYDLALFTRYAMKNPKFREIVKTRYKQIDGPGNSKRHLHNTNKLLWGCTWADGVKTGTTNAAGCCLVASASMNGRHLISVVLHSDDRYGDTKKLFAYGFNSFEEIVITSKGEYFTTVSVEEGYARYAPVIAEDNLYVLVPKRKRGVFEQRVILKRTLTAPVRAHSKVGRVTVLVNNQEVGSVNLITGCAVDRLPRHFLIYRKLRQHL
ncbi:D-alanyl-D-alanine carboxypeptidase (penicillin-binding protein 5/6) [Desulfohalotomaculum tongense]|uniref:D-alanyl-D-alanine carboxypeptidase family protein n=1 Tax=Desulforadius tongensis TaxID=1216062 RepID=UPI001956C18C|nr:D-alanyl-D-alanine carboxypeptidase family protein [Desulforadius tongensis]MBM7854449.1 D-alanyl-D-alanine carboxypeptidase (penicillin-binding protein 5/6) [Desulforadius tongensis]